MRFNSRLIAGAFLSWMAIIRLPTPVCSQEVSPSSTIASAVLPEAPDPQTASPQPQPSGQPQPAQTHHTEAGSKHHARSTSRLRNRSAFLASCPTTAR